MSTNKQRRESERARLQRQLEQRRQREASHKRLATIASIVGALVLVAAIVIVVVVSTSGKDDTTAAKPKKSPSPAPTTSAPSTPVAQAPPDVPKPTKPCAAPSKGSTATYSGLTITGATNLKKAPKVTGKAADADPKTVQCDDLVVGKGKAASVSSTATVEYVGLVYKSGTVFQSSWDSMPATFPLAPASATNQQGVITGFSQGIAGAGKVAPMKEGGRRVIVMPGAAAYGANPPQGSNIPANASLVFVVDLQKLAS